MSKIVNRQTSKQSVAQYVLTPGFTPELRRLGHSLGHFAHLIALIFARAGIFKVNHPYVNPANIGKFGLGSVFAAAGQAIRLDRKHFPQAAIYLATITLVVLMSAQVMLTVVTIGVGEARAAAPVFTCTGACDPANDLALNFLGDIFGEYDFITEGNAGARTPTPVHYGLWELLAYYSNALLIVATFIVLYYVVSAVGETAVYGTPFGRRFNSVWAPLRLVTALGLLVPLPMAGLGGAGVGLNSGQYIVLFAAKSGSNLATNALSIFTTAVSTASYAQSFVAQPSMPTIDSLVQGTFAWALCAAGVESAGWSETIDLLDGEGIGGAGTTAFDKAAPNYLNFWVKSDDPAEYGWTRIGGDGAWPNPPTPPTGNQVLNHYKNEFGPSGADVQIGAVQIAMGPPGLPTYCGVMSMPQGFMADENDAASLTNPGAGGAGKFAFPNEVRELYIDQISFLWGGGGGPPSMHDVAEDIACMQMSQGCLPGDFGDPTLLPNLDVASNWVTAVRNNIIPVLSDAARRNAYAVQNAIDMNNAFVSQRGWAAAALYFNEIMRANQVLSHAANGVPMMVDAPVPLEHYQQENPTLSEGVGNGSGMQGANGFDSSIQPSSMQLGKGGGNPFSQVKGLTGNTSAQENSANVEASFDFEMGNVVGTGLRWFNQAPTVEKQAQAGDAGGANAGCSIDNIAFEPCARWIFGVDGFYNLANNDPRTENPLVVMQSIGSQLVNRTILLTAIAAGVGIASPAAGNALFAMAGIGFSVGVFLAYVLPLLPFLFFFFGVVQWGFSVFEAVVAAPLWALSHLRIDGEGLPGPAAMNGYYLIFEIFLRPILLLLGLIAASVCFTAGAYLLHQTWSVVTDPLTSKNPLTGWIDALVFMLLYALVSYMLANSSFKLITMIPQSILRWMGQGGATPLSDMFQGTSQMLQQGGMGVGAVGGGLLSSGGKGAAGGIRSLAGRGKGKGGPGAGKR